MKPKSIAHSLKPLPADKRAALERLRKIVHAAAPGAEECISYGLPSFKVNGRTMFWMGAAAQHCAIYGAVPPACRQDFKAFDQSKGTIRFQPDTPPAAAAVRKLIKARIAGYAARNAKR